MSRSDVDNPHHATSDTNAHTFGSWRQQHKGFNIIQVVDIEENQLVRMDAISKTGLATCRSRSTMEGYQEKISDLVDSSMYPKVKL